MVAILSLSGPTLASCESVVEAMRAMGISGDVTSNVSVVDGAPEPGCRVLVASRHAREQSRRLWTAMRAHHDLTCAHVSLEGDRTSGCVLDVFRPSLCPGDAE